MTSPTFPSPSEQLAVLRSSRAVAIVAGLIALVAGVVVLAWPDQTVQVVARVVGVFLIIAGLAQIIDALVTHRQGTYWGLLLLRGVIDLAIGVVAVAWPDITVWALVVLIGLELIIGGIVSVVVSFRTPKEFESRSRYLWRGIITIIAGVVVIAWPDATVLVVAIVLGVYLVILGLVLLWAGYQLGKVERTAPSV
jgi:uncharacterized membrane protein HdeD (DUF308 family)